MTAVPVQTYARIAGVLFLISAVAGGFGEFFVPFQLIVSNDATATANNIVASELLFRMGFVGYLDQSAEIWPYSQCSSGSWAPLSLQ